jgi:hypothetical protein
MDRTMAGVTCLVLAIPVAVAVAMVLTGEAAAIPFVVSFFALVFGVVWLWSRPTSFVLDGEALTVRYPVRRYVYPRSQLTTARILDRRELERELGLALRIGVGGLWGVFGWLWTRRRGLVDVYVSRTDEYLWIERRGRRPIVLTCEDVRELRAELAA